MAIKIAVDGKGRQEMRSRLELYKQGEPYRGEIEKKEAEKKRLEGK